MIFTLPIYHIDNAINMFRRADDYHTIESFWIEGESSESRYFTAMPITETIGVSIEMKVTTQGFTEDHVEKKLRIEVRLINL